MDYVDLYQIHRFDNETPIEETLETLHDVVRAGKARYIGASSTPVVPVVSSEPAPWLFRDPAVAAPVVGVTRLEQLDEFAAGLTVRLTDEEAGAVEALAIP